MMGLYWQI